MSDQNKLALLCILIVVAVSIWSHPKNPNEGDSMPHSEDLFQTAQSNVDSPFSSNSSSISSSEQHALQAKTSEGEFSDSPFL